MRVIICGSRDWTDPEPIRRELTRLLSEPSIRKHDFRDGDWVDTSAVTLVHGDQRGADRLARDIAKEMGFEVIPVPAEWEKYGKSAGPRRNERMLREFGPIDLVLAFHEDLAKSKGTKDMVNRAIRDGIPMKIISKPKTGSKS